MRFCAIEYQTKSDKIWRPTKDKPNYLSDPDKEIDPTSFGCWTSALAGEHIPLSYFEGDKPFIVKLNRKLFKEKRGFKNLRYLERFDTILILIHDFSIVPLAKFLKAARRKYPNKKYLGSIVHPLERLRLAWKDSKVFYNFFYLLNNVDHWISVNKDAQDYLAAMSFNKNKIIYLPQFYPFDFAKQAFTKLENKERKIFVAGDMERPDNLYGQFIASHLQTKFPDYQIVITANGDSNLWPLRLTKARFEVIAPEPWQKHLDRLRKFYLVINTDASFTLGRVQSDCAICGTPSIGLNSNNQREFFPELSFDDIFEVNKMLSAGERLIADKDFYLKTQSYAFSKIKESSYKNSLALVKKLLNLK